MTEMGIQMELKRGNSGTMHRAITRKPRVDSNSKPARLSSRSSDASDGSDHEDRASYEYDNFNIDLTFSIENTTNQPDKGNGRSIRRQSSKKKEISDNQLEPDEMMTKTKSIKVQQIAIQSHQTKPAQAPQDAKQTSIKSKLRLTRTLSFDNVIHQSRSSRHPSFLLKHDTPSGKEKHASYDAGSQIMENYTDQLQYSAGTPRPTKGKRVRSFFRRLAGSLESLLGIRRKSGYSHDSQEIMTPSPPGPDRPGKTSHNPYDTSHNEQSSEKVASTEATVSSQGYDILNATVPPSGSRQNPTANSPDDIISFYRGKRLYTPRDPSTLSITSLVTPTPPRKPTNKRHRGLRQAGGRRRRHIRRGSHPEFTDASNDWETRSDTDSEGYAFQSNRLKSRNDSSPSDFSDKVDDAGEEYQAAATEPMSKRSIPVKISEFRPPSGDYNIQMRTSRQRSKESTRNKGPMRALQSNLESTMSRSESTGKFDKNSKRHIKRKIRRRNSSFVPCKDPQSPMLVSSPALQEAMSFERIMSDINELADTLDKVSMSSNQQLHGSSNKVSCQDANAKIERDTSESKDKSPGQTSPRQSQLSRNESWVGKVSNRLDILIEPKDGESKAKVASNNANDVEKPGPRSESQNSSRVRIKKRKSNVIRKEKVSFDELESDFRKFAQEVRGRMRSTEKVNAVGS